MLHRWVRVTCVFVNETHTEHLLFHHDLHVFVATCVIMEMLIEFGDQSQKLPKMVLVSPLLRERLGVSSSFWMGELLFGSAHNLI